MIRLRRNRAAAAIPASFKGDSLTKRARTLIDLYYSAGASGMPISFDSSFWKPAKGALKKETGGKCAYCEASTETVAHGDVEHFRPKSIYWWLAFCYDNYLFACQLCNQTYKGDNFPVFGQPMPAPVMPALKPAGAALDALAVSLVLDAQALGDPDIVALWSTEDAHLPNPYFEDPADLFVYEVDVENEEIWIRSAGTDRSDRAIDAAEKFLGLNREALRRDRYAAYEVLLVFKSVLAESTLRESTRRMVERHVSNLQRQRYPFSGMNRYFAAKWHLPGPK